MGLGRRRHRCGRWSLLLALVLGVAVPVTTPAGATAAASPTTWYVAPWGDDAATGTADDPVATVRHAVWRARSGDTVALAGATYREHVRISGKAIHLTSVPGERAVFDGAVALSGWRAGGSDWFVDGWTRQFPAERGDIVPTTTPAAGHPDQLFFDGRPLRQVLRRGDVVAGTFFHDTAGDRVYVGDDPTGHLVEASDVEWALHFDQAHGSTLSDITVRRFATSTRDLATIRIFSDDVVVSGVVSELNAAAGISIIGDGVVVRSSAFTDNGHLGLHAHRSNRLVVEDSVVTGNNQALFDPKHSAGGIKITTSGNVTVQRNEVSRNHGPGIWTDLSVTSATIAFNRVDANGRAGIEVELSERVSVVGNSVVGNGEAGVWVLESGDVTVMHNALYGNVRQVDVLDGPRGDVSSVNVRNNVMGAGRGGSVLVSVDDWTNERSADEMGVSIDSNAYWFPSWAPVERLSRWGGLTTTTWISATLEVHRRRTGQDRTSVVSRNEANPFAVDWRGGDHRPTSAAPLGRPVDGWIAQVLGVDPGTRLPVGLAEPQP